MPFPVNAPFNTNPDPGRCNLVIDAQTGDLASVDKAERIVINARHS